MQNRVLKPAVFSLLEGGPNPKKITWDKREITAWWNKIQEQFSAAWPADFFPWLWSAAEQPDQSAARLQWLRALCAKAEALFELAIVRYPHRAERRYRARVRAEGLFIGSLYKDVL